MMWEMTQKVAIMQGISNVVYIFNKNVFRCSQGFPFCSIVAQSHFF